jgi:hypothetical protein
MRNQNETTGKGIKLLPILKTKVFEYLQIND